MIVTKVLKASDNTGKISIKLDDNTVIESVLLVDQSNRATACVSSQAGCSQGCVFCQTGKLGLKRNLTTEEIISQYDLLKETFNRDITNIVYMGMGEPLHNIKNVLKSVKIFTDPKKYNIFLRRITISTSGVANKISELTKEKPYPGLAFSLVTANRELRKKLLPGTPDLQTIKSELLKYQKLSNKRIIFEVICFKDINVTKEEARAIADFASELDVIINLIPYNKTKESDLLEPDLDIVKTFSKYIIDLGLKVTIRHSKGQEISGACGQLGEV